MVAWHIVGAQPLLPPCWSMVVGIRTIHSVFLHNADCHIFMVTVDANSLARYELNLTGKDKSWVCSIVTGKLFVRIFVRSQQFPIKCLLIQKPFYDIPSSSGLIWLELARNAKLIRSSNPSTSSYPPTCWRLIGKWYQNVFNGCSSCMHSRWFDKL